MVREALAEKFVPLRMYAAFAAMITGGLLAIVLLLLVFVFIIAGLCYLIYKASVDNSVYDPVYKRIFPFVLQLIQRLLTQGLS